MRPSKAGRRRRGSRYCRGVRAERLAICGHGTRLEVCEAAETARCLTDTRGLIIIVSYTWSTRREVRGVVEALFEGRDRAGSRWRARRKRGVWLWSGGRCGWGLGGFETWRRRIGHDEWLCDCFQRWYKTYLASANALGYKAGQRPKPAGRFGGSLSLT